MHLDWYLDFSDGGIYRTQPRLTTDHCLPQKVNPETGGRIPITWREYKKTYKKYLPKDPLGLTKKDVFGSHPAQWTHPDAGDLINDLHLSTLEGEKLQEDYDELKHELELKEARLKEVREAIRKAEGSAQDDDDGGSASQQGPAPVPSSEGSGKQVQTTFSQSSESQPTSMDLAD